jgi:hypothetical protein
VTYAALLVRNVTTSHRNHCGRTLAMTLKSMLNRTYASFTIGNGMSWLHGTCLDTTGSGMNL